MLIDEAPEELVINEPDNLEEMIDYSSMITEANERASELKTRRIIAGIFMILTTIWMH